MSRTVPKGAARIAVETALESTLSCGPMDAEQIAKRAGVEITLARSHIGNCVAHGLAHNLLKGKRGSALYLWGREPRVQVGTESRSFVPVGPYKGERSDPPRGDASMIAFGLPSMENGVSKARTRPAFISSRV